MTKANDWRLEKDYTGKPCTMWSGKPCPNGGRKNFTETVLCIERNETITGKYEYRATLSDVPKYDSVVNDPRNTPIKFYPNLIRTQVFGSQQTNQIKRELPALLKHCSEMKPPVSPKDCKSVVVRETILAVSIYNCTCLSKTAFHFINRSSFRKAKPCLTRCSRQKVVPRVIMCHHATQTHLTRMGGSQTRTGDDPSA